MSTSTFAAHGSWSAIMIASNDFLPMSATTGRKSWLIQSGSSRYDLKNGIVSPSPFAFSRNRPDADSPWSLRPYRMPMRFQPRSFAKSARAAVMTESPGVRRKT